MNLIKEIARHLEYCDIGIADETDERRDIFWGLMPDSPNDCICVYSSGESDAGARIQIMVRSPSTKTAYERSQQIYEVLDDYCGYLSGDGVDAYISTLNASVGVGADAKRREMYSSNYLVQHCR